ncbi:glutamate--tRNA ligase [Candidatus Woesearchaeota archaeon]|nr:glutamate--tRNA ligase [Candidatus Woesearchaeota archaeon]
MDLTDLIRELALRNAAKFGKANANAVLGSVLKARPEQKQHINLIKQHVQGIVNEINTLDSKTLQQAIAALPEKEKETPKEKTLKDLPNVSNSVIMRFAPSPSGPLHIAHAYGLSLNYHYAKRYHGTFLFRIEDTNPENIYAPAYDMMVEDAQWLTNNGIDHVIIQSDRLGRYYDIAEQLVDKEKAYVCTCNSDEFRTLLFKKTACPCRTAGVKEHLKRYAAMFSSYKPGEAVLRSKTDITHKNPAMRDFPLMRINEHPHPRTGTEHRVWPLMNLAVFVDDMDYHVTHIIRAKEHRDNAARQEFLYNAFDHPVPVTLFVGRINFTDMKVSCSATKAAIEEGKYTGWEDIRLPFLRPLRRRGYQQEAFMKYAIEIGISQADKTVKKEEYFKTLNAFNKDIIDAHANRYFFLHDPVPVHITDVEQKTITIALHPDVKDRGLRTFKINGHFLLERKDVEQLPDGLHRLMDCLNFIKKGQQFTFHSFAYDVFKQEGQHILHWLPAQDTQQVIVHQPDGKQLQGVGETTLQEVEIGSLIQFERFGFARLDAHTRQALEFWYAHR